MTPKVRGGNPAPKKVELFKDFCSFFFSEFTPEMENGLRILDPNCFPLNQQLTLTWFPNLHFVRLSGAPARLASVGRLTKMASLWYPASL